MGFLNGRVTFTRFQVGGTPLTFTPEHLAKLEDNRFGTNKIATADGSQFGWAGGEHVLDVRFDPYKNIVNNALLFDLRIDEIKIPGDLLRSYYLVEANALGSANPSGKPTAKQKREARTAAKERLAEEAKDGRFTRRRLVPVLWDGNTNRLLVGNASDSVIDRLMPLFKRTFGLELSAIDATLRACCSVSGEDVESAEPAKFVSGSDEIQWVVDENSRNWLGNEFFLWLWWHTLEVSDTFKAVDNSDVVAMLNGTLALECPRGQYGKETFTGDGPTHLPEARRALKGGRLPRKTGITLVRHDEAFEFALTAESLTFKSAKLPKSEAEDERARLEERIDKIRDLQDAVDQLYGIFLAHRFGSGWPDDLKAIQEWLATS